jgi:hypothetical protein
MTGDLPRSLRAFLLCVAAELAAYFVVLLTRSTQEPPNCDDYCMTDRDIALFWGLLVAAPVVIGQFVVGGILIALAARKDNWSLAAGLYAFVGSTALMVALVYGYYTLQAS